MSDGLLKHQYKRRLITYSDYKMVIIIEAPRAIGRKCETITFYLLPLNASVQCHLGVISYQLITSLERSRSHVTH